MPSTEHMFQHDQPSIAQHLVCKPSPKNIVGELPLPWAMPCCRVTSVPVCVRVYTGCYSMKENCFKIDHKQLIN